MVAAILPGPLRPGDRPKGDLTDPVPVDSIGDVLVFGEDERAWPLAGIGGKPMVRCSGLEVDIIDYSLPTVIQRRNCKGGKFRLGERVGKDIDNN